MGGSFIDFDIPDIDAYVRHLDDINEELNNQVIKTMQAGAQKISDMQKRIVSFKSDTLANYITIEKSQTSKNKAYYKIGYLEASTVKQWLHGAVLEFGRPGKRGRGTIKQTRYGKEIEVRNGYMEEFSHIRVAYDLLSEGIVQDVKREFDKVVSKLGDNNG